MNSLCSQLFVIFFALPMLGCGAVHVNQPLRPEAIHNEEKSEYTFQDWFSARQRCNKSDPQCIPEEDLIVLSFSGGGVRASTLAASVLQKLKKDGLDKKIAVISSTSGGSVTAGFFAAKGATELDSFEKAFLSFDNMSALIPRLWPSFLTGKNRSLQFADYLDERIFDGNEFTYKNLIDRWRSDSSSPFVILNSSDASTGRTFEFTQDSFSNLCSDIKKFRLSAAIAASAAVPFVMTPVPLKNFFKDEDYCKSKEFDFRRRYEPFVRNRYLRLSDFVEARYYHSLHFTGYEGADPNMTPYRRIDYVHLMDGGLSDNLAARALLKTFSADTIASLLHKGVKRILLIQVNAKTDESHRFDRSVSAPSWLETFETLASNPIDVATELSSYISADYWVSVIRWVNAAPELKQEGEKLKFYAVQVDFDLWNTSSAADRQMQMHLKQINTSWTISNGDFEKVNNAGEVLLSNHPCYQWFLHDIKRNISPSPGCDGIEVLPIRQVAVAKPVAPAAPAPAPKPAGEKITLAADALFDFDKAVLRPEGKAKLDDVAQKAKALKLEVILAVGHTDRIGKDAYNQKLSEKRGAAIKEYLVSKGFEANRVYTEGKGEKQPVTGDKCKGLGAESGKNKKLVECLQPDRRVDIEVIGTR